MKEQFSAQDREALTAVLERFGSSFESFIALRPDCYEHALARQSVEHLELLYSELLKPAQDLEETQANCPPWPKNSLYAGKPPSTRTLGGIAERLRTEATLNSLGRVSGFLSKLRSRAQALPVGQQAEVLDSIVTLVGEEMIQAKLAGAPLSANLDPLDRLLIANSAKTKARIEEEKLKLRTQAEERATQKLGLERQKFRRQTCELFLKWSEDKRANDIAAGGSTHEEKIKALDQLMFPEDWPQAPS